jgi:hypothetical protein
VVRRVGVGFEAEKNLAADGTVTLEGLEWGDRMSRQ